MKYSVISSALLYLLVQPALAATVKCSECSDVYQQVNEQPNVKNCRQWFELLSDSVEKAQVTDAQTAVITSFPYLRNDRFYASYTSNSLKKAEFFEWLDGARELGHQAWDIQLANLSINDQAALYRQQYTLFGKQPNLLSSVDNCAYLLQQVDIAEKVRREQLWTKAAAQLSTEIPEIDISDDQVTAWRSSVLRPFQQAVTQLKPVGQLRRYAPPSAKRLTAPQVATLLQQSRSPALNIPQLSPKDLASVFATFAPVFEIDTLSPEDGLGVLEWLTINSKPVIATAEPTVYTFASYTRFQGKILLQLNYMLWFPARSGNPELQLNNGYLDNLIWRITLDDNGKILIADTFKNGSGEHLFFPGEQLQWKTFTATTPAQQPLAPAKLPLQTIKTQPWVLRISAGNHQLQRIYIDKVDNAIPYDWRPYESLASLPYPRVKLPYRSIFNTQGIIPGTQRNTAWFTWENDEENSGSLQQWGHQAILLGGEGFFDDAFLLQRYFQLK